MIHTIEVYRNSPDGSLLVGKMERAQPLSEDIDRRGKLDDAGMTEAA